MRELATAVRVAGLEVDLAEVFPDPEPEAVPDVEPDDDGEIRERWWSFDGASA